MQSDINTWVSLKVQPVLFFAQTALAVPLFPGFASSQIEIGDQKSFFRAVNFFIAAVGATITAETAFSYFFQTEFSDWIHYSLPIFAAVTGSAVVFLFLKMLLTMDLPFKHLTHCFLIVAGSALFVGVIISLMIIGTYFYGHWDLIRDAPCAHRTISCLLSGGKTYEYGAAPLPSYVSLLPIFLFGFILYYTVILSSYLKKHLGVARWRTFIACLLSVFLLVPSHIYLVDGIYRFVYGS